MVAPQVSINDDKYSETGRLSKRQRAKRRAASIPRLGAHSCYSIPRVALTAILPQQQPFRDQAGSQEENLVLMPDDSEESWVVKRIWREDRKSRDVYLGIEKGRLEKVDLESGCAESVSCWGETDYMNLLANLTDDLKLNLYDCAASFGVVTVPNSTNGWRFHPALGFVKRR